MDTWTKGKSYLSKLGGDSWMHAIAMGGIRKGPICAKRYTFMLTNPAYEVSFGFTNIYGLALSTWIFIYNIWWHHKRDLILKGEIWTDCTFIIEETAKLNLRVKFFYNVIQIFRKFNT